VRFDVLDVAKLPCSPPFTLIAAFDAIHDQLDPATVLARINAALEDEGTFVIGRFKFASDVAGNIGNPFAPLTSALAVVSRTMSRPRPRQRATPVETGGRSDHGKIAARLP
jgi:hypothetical protein